MLQYHCKVKPSWKGNDMKHIDWKDEQGQAIHDWFFKEMRTDYSTVWQRTEEPSFIPLGKQLDGHWEVSTTTDVVLRSSVGYQYDDMGGRCGIDAYCCLPIFVTYKNDIWHAGNAAILVSVNNEDGLRVSMDSTPKMYGITEKWTVMGGHKAHTPLPATKNKYAELLGSHRWADGLAENVQAALSEKLDAFLGKDDINELEALREELEAAKAESAKAIADASLETLMKQAMISTLEPVMEAKAKEMAQKFEDEGMLPTVLQVEVADKVSRVEGLVHEKFGTILTMVENGIPVFLVGPAGTGKNHLAEQIATATGREFEFMGQVSDKFADCVGYRDANGCEHETPLTRAVRDGKLLFIDEIDASIPEVLVTVNALLANRYMVTGGGTFLRAHEDFRVIVAGNTVGRGADRTYTGRYALDGATLDRFVLVDVDYDPRIEEHLSRGNADVLEYVRAFRAAVAAVGGMPHPVTYRTITNMATLDAAGLDKVTILKSCLTKELDMDDVRILNDWVANNRSGITSNGYYQACKSLV